MKASIFSYTRNGAKISLLVRSCLQELGYIVNAYAPEKYVGVHELLIKSQGCSKDAARAFTEDRLIIYIGSSGIAVRSIAPFVKSKTTDPAVISIDEQGRYVIPLLSGHIGGANSVARRLAQILNAEPIITTATDINGLFAVDEWAVKNNLHIGSMYAAKEFAAALVDGEKIGLSSTYKLSDDELPKGIEISSSNRVGFVISDNPQDKPYQVTLNLLPKVYYLGIGCRRNTPEEKIASLVLPKLKALNLTMASIAGIASVDLKQDEQGLLSFARKYKLPITFYTAQELSAVEGVFSPSAFVQSVVGVNNVCERSAVKASDNGKLILAKTSQEGVTLAIAKKQWQVSFKY